MYLIGITKVVWCLISSCRVFQHWLLSNKPPNIIQSLQFTLQGGIFDLVPNIPKDLSLQCQRVCAGCRATREVGQLYGPLVKRLRLVVFIHATRVQLTHGLPISFIKSGRGATINNEYHLTHTKMYVWLRFKKNLFLTVSAILLEKLFKIGLHCFKQNLNAKFVLSSK